MAASPRLPRASKCLGCLVKHHCLALEDRVVRLHPIDDMKERKRDGRTDRQSDSQTDRKKENTYSPRSTRRT